MTTPNGQLNALIHVAILEIASDRHLPIDDTLAMLMTRAAISVYEAANQKDDE